MAMPFCDLVLGFSTLLDECEARAAEQSEQSEQFLYLSLSQDFSWDDSDDSNAISLE
jgi:hypothetical protein